LIWHLSFTLSYILILQGMGILILVWVEKTFKFEKLKILFFYYYFLLLLYIYKKYFLCITYCTQFEANSKVWFSGWIWVNSAHCLPWAIAMLEPILCIAGAWTEPLSEKMMHSAQRRVQIIDMFLSKSGLTSKVVCKRHAAASGAYFSCLNSIQRIVGSAWDWDKDPRDAMPRNFNFHWLGLLVGR
jgi:hypothetical protein